MFDRASAKFYSFDSYGVGATTNVMMVMVMVVMVSAVLFLVFLSCLLCCLWCFCRAGGGTCCAASCDDHIDTLSGACCLPLCSF